VKRGLFIAVSWVSLVICVAVAGLWVRSYFVVDRLNNQPRPGRDYGMLSVEGRLIFATLKTRTDGWNAGWPKVYGLALWISQGVDDIPIPPDYSFSRSDFDASSPTRFNFFGMVFSKKLRSCYDSSDTLDFVSLPMWMVAAPAAVLPLIRLRRGWRARRRRVEGLCLVCGYDLRATPDRCPECGTVPAKHA
jgi:4-amino-4-deoxy-L-arabinose transferase-like glycosyltransferase